MEVIKPRSAGNRRIFEFIQLGRSLQISDRFVTYPGRLEQAKIFITSFEKKNIKPAVKMFNLFQGASFQWSWIRVSELNEFFSTSFPRWSWIRVSS